MSNIEPWAAEALVNHLRKLVDQAYTLTPLDIHSLEWEGPDLTSPKLLAGAPGVRDSLTPESLEYHAERDRDVMTVLLWAAFRLGIEQGFRIIAEDKFLAREIAELVPPDKKKWLIERVSNPGQVKPS